MAIDDAAEVLVYSDNPETVQTPIDGVLYRAETDGKARIRIFFYHANASSSVRTFGVVIRNASGNPVSYRALSAVPAPLPGADTVRTTGHRAAVEFLQLFTGAAVWPQPAALADGASAVLASVDVRVGSIGCGYVEVNTDPAKLTFSVVVAASAADLVNAAENAQLRNDTGTSFAFDSVSRCGVYELKPDHHALVYDAARPAPRVATIVETPSPNSAIPSDWNHVRKTDSTYGVLSRVIVTLRNTANVPREAALYYEPHGGNTTATLMVDGALIGVGFTDQHPDSRLKLAVYPLAPGETKLPITILTTGEPAGSLPFRIIVDANDATPNPGTPGSIVYAGNAWRFREPVRVAKR
jgi:hypothetical protein